jgi:hypothetical protein
METESKLLKMKKLMPVATKKRINNLIKSVIIIMVLSFLSINKAEASGTNPVTGSNPPEVKMEHLCVEKSKHSHHDVIFKNRLRPHRSNLHSKVHKFRTINFAEVSRIRV